MDQLPTTNTFTSHISIPGAPAHSPLEETSSVPGQIDLNHPLWSSLGAIAHIDQRGPITYRPLSTLDTPSSLNELIINKGWLCKHQSTDGMMDWTAWMQTNTMPSFFGPWVSFTPHDQACTGAPTLLIKYPQVALVFQQGCFLSVHYWHIFNNSWSCITEDGA